jgi:hypothetical protein
MTPTCVDLHAIFGARYRIRREADGVTWYATLESERVWLLEIPCRYGIVYPQGGDILAATITSRIMGRRVAALPGILSSRGDLERVVAFCVDDAEAVLAIMQPRLRRRLSPAQRARTTAQLQRINQERRDATPKRVGNDPQIDAAAGNDLGPAPEVADAGNSSTVAVSAADELAL